MYDEFPSPFQKSIQLEILSTKEQPRPPVPKLITLNKGLKLAQQWVNNMPGDAEEAAGEIEVEGRPAGLGLGAKVPPKSQFQPSNDPIERNLMKRLGVGRKKPDADHESPLPANSASGRKKHNANRESPLPANSNFDSDDDDDENLESRTNSFNKKRAAPQILLPQAKQKQNR